MPDPTEHDEGGWGDLARELGVEPTPSATEPTVQAEQPPPLPQTADATADDEGFADGLSGDEETGDDADGEDGPEGEGGEPGQPGTGRKRRRRRRRRKKGGPEGADAATVAATVGEEEAGVVSAVPTEADEHVDEDAPPDDADDTHGDVEDDEPDARPLAAEEDTGSDVLRELIATWNVPAWDDIIGGLYRPDR